MEQVLFLLFLVSWIILLIMLNRIMKAVEWLVEYTMVAADAPKEEGDGPSQHD